MVCVVCRLSLLAFCVYFSHVCHPIRNSWYHQYDSKMGTAYIPVYTGYLYIWKHTGEWPILSFIAINRNPLMTIFMENVTWYSSHHCYNYETVPSMKCVFRSIWREINYNKKNHTGGVKQCCCLWIQIYIDPSPKQQHCRMPNKKYGYQWLPPPRRLHHHHTYCGCTNNSTNNNNSTSTTHTTTTTTSAATATHDDGYSPP